MRLYFKISATPFLTISLRSTLLKSYTEGTSKQTEKKLFELQTETAKRLIQWSFNGVMSQLYPISVCASTIVTHKTQQPYSMPLQHAGTWVVEQSIYIIKITITFAWPSMVHQDYVIRIKVSWCADCGVTKQVEDGITSGDITGRRVK